MIVSIHHERERYTTCDDEPHALRLHLTPGCRRIVLPGGEHPALAIGQYTPGRGPPGGFLKINLRLATYSVWCI